MARCTPRGNDPGDALFPLVGRTVQLGGFRLIVWWILSSTRIVTYMHLFGLRDGRRGPPIPRRLAW